MSEAYEAAGAPDGGDESPAEAGDYGGYHEAEADTQARIADQDNLSAPAESAPADSGAATGDDNPDYDDETDLGSAYDSDASALAADQGKSPAPEQPHADVWGDNPDYYQETDLATEYDGDLTALTTKDRTSDTGDDHAPDSRAGNQDPPAAEEPDNPPPEAPDISAPTAPGHVDGNVTVPESSPAEASADAASTADVGDQSGEAPQAEQIDARTGQATRPDNGTGPDTAPDASQQESKAEQEARLKEEVRNELRAEFKATLEEQGKELRAEFQAMLKQQAAENNVLLGEQAAEYEVKLEDQRAASEARVNELKAEVQALKDRQQAAPDALENTGSNADQPYDSALPLGKKNSREAEHKDDRPGLLSNAKYALYGAVGTPAMTAALSEFVLDSPSSAVVALVSGAPGIVAALVPTRREGWKWKHDDSPNKP